VASTNRSREGTGRRATGCSPGRLAHDGIVTLIHPLREVQVQLALRTGWPSTRVAAMYETHNDLSQSIRSRMIELLNARLADAIDLRLQLKVDADSWLEARRPARGFISPPLPAMQERPPKAKDCTQ
jgi:hypothetical protein